MAFNNSSNNDTESRAFKPIYVPNLPPPPPFSPDSFPIDPPQPETPKIPINSSILNNFENYTEPPTERENVLYTIEEFLCAPYPPCNPFGCGRGIAPIDCPKCDKVGVGFALLGMSLLAILIVFTNILVITVISRHSNLRRRHGHIKVSLAVGDLLIGLFVLPSAIYNLVTTLYLPPPVSKYHYEEGSYKYFTNRIEEFRKVNEFASVFFGTIWVVSLVASIYNLLLLSLDRLFAVARPLQTQTGKLLSKRRLKYCLAFIWIVSLFVSFLPCLIPSHFSYILDDTTFFFLLTISISSTAQSVGYIAFVFVVMIIPYCLTAIVSLITMVLTIKKLKFSKNNSTRMATAEQKKRMKLIMASCPEMKYEKKKSGMNLLKKYTFNQSSNNAHSMTRERTESIVSTTFDRMKHLPSTAKEMNTKVTVMILSMVSIFTICIFPYAIVSSLMATQSIGCSSIGVSFNIVVYLLFLNSSVNFFIYNLWHKEFREKLLGIFKRSRYSTSSSQKATTTTTTVYSDRRRFSIGPSHGRSPASVYRAKKARGGFSFKTQQHNSLERESRF